MGNCMYAVQSLKNSRYFVLGAILLVTGFIFGMNFYDYGFVRFRRLTSKKAIGSQLTSVNRTQKPTLLNRRPTTQVSQHRSRSTYTSVGTSTTRAPTTPKKRTTTTISPLKPTVHYEEFKCSKEKRNKINDICDTIEKKQVSQEHKKVFLELLEYIVQSARRKNWVHFILYGTLLGSWRHHGFIPWDIDIDMYFPLENRADIMAFVGNQTEFVVSETLHGKELKLFSKSKSNIQYSYKGTGSWKGPYIDLYFYKTTKTMVYCATFNSLIWSKSDVFPLHDRPFEHLTVPAPKNPLTLLQKFYGETSDCQLKDGRRYNCSDLNGVLPFVHRRFSNGKIIETLKLGDKVIHVKNVSETVQNMPKSPFSLENL